MEWKVQWQHRTLGATLKMVTMNQACRKRGTSRMCVIVGCVALCSLLLGLVTDSEAWTPRPAIVHEHRAHPSSRACTSGHVAGAHIHHRIHHAEHKHKLRLPVSQSTTSTYSSTDDSNEDDPATTFKGTVEIVDRGQHHVVVNKPPSTVCHHSAWSGSRSKNRAEIEFPMLQRTREAVGERVNLVHRLDRGASGCLLCALSKSDADGNNATATFQEAMVHATKTYIALVRGEGILHGRNFQTEGWFEITRPIKDENGVLNNATTSFRFIAGQDNGNGAIDRPRASLVLARPKTGRWHQIRRHLNGLSHPIIGDSSHGNSKLNREWRRRWGLQPERTCLHLLQLELPDTPYAEDGLHVQATLAPDMIQILEDHLPKLLEDAAPILREEGLTLEPELKPSHSVVNITLHAATL